MDWRKVLLLSIATLLSLAATAREKELPVDPELRIGRLENGMTYYIRHNEQPKGRAEFWLVQNTGSLVEEDNERGLAHFIEHIAFQGTRNFPGIDMVDILQNKGVSYGRDINASTGFDDTRFQISNVPTDRVELLDTVLLMLKDLSCELNFEDRAIEEERGVVQEEWRMHADQTMRMYESTLPILLSGSRYAFRIPIGDMTVIRNVTHGQLLSFYHRWYCPSRQAIVIVGDIDAARMEGMLKQVMNSIPKRDVPVVSDDIGKVPDHAGINYALHTDPEASSSMTYLMFKHQQMPVALRNSHAFLRHNIISTLAQYMLTDRLDEMARTHSSPIDYGMVYDRKYLVTRTTDALTLAAIIKEGRSTEALDSLITQAARVRQYGFTPSEFDRACRNVQSVYDNLRIEASNRTNREYVDEYIDHYENGGYIPGVITESQMLLDELQLVTLDDVNNYVQHIIGKDNVSVLISGPQSMGGNSRYPTSRDVIAHFNRIMDSPQSPYIDMSAGKRLIENEPVMGAIINETYDEATGVTTMTLHNGATVRLKPTTFKNNEVLFNAFSLGGEWAYGDTADINVRLMDQVIENCALGGHTINQLNRMMSGRQLGLSFLINDANEQLNGGCQSADLETLLQLCYLYFTDVSLDQDAYLGVKTRIRSQLSQAQYNPKMIYSDSIGSTIYQGNPMYRNLKPEEVDNLDGNRVLELYRQRVANAGDYSFSIVGAFDIDAVRPLIRRYLASLPDNGVRESNTGYRPAMAIGEVDNFFEVPMRNPKTSVYVSIMGDKKYSYDDEFLMDLVGESVGTALLTFLRHEKHGTYDVASDGSLSIYNNRWMINYEFETNTADRDSMLVYADYAVNAIFYSGVSEDLFNKMKENISLQHENAMRTNSYWMRALQMRALGIDVIGGYDNLFPSLTQDLLNNYIAALRPHTRVRIVMN
ncbi:MAG: insulinase family protein [Muribaculaceae bacterium]|nr:insulinase family protein [Muribaculaceae bacterium]